MMRAIQLCAAVALGAALTTGAGVFAKRRAPIAAAVTPMPTAAPEVAETDVTGTTEAIAVRLTESLGEAQVEIPQLDKGLALFARHWRRMQAPWPETARHGRSKLVQLVAMRTSARETAHVVQTAAGESVAIDVRKWNTSEGSFSQREAIVAPTPATLRFRLRVPAAAALEIAPAVLALEGEQPSRVTFRARVRPVSGGSVERKLADSVEPKLADSVERKLADSVERKLADSVELGALSVGDATTPHNRWHERRFSLEAFAGQEIELELGAESESLAIALWGTPRIVRKTTPAVPWNVLWIVVDALRPDVIPSFHDPAVDAAKRAAKIPPRDTLLPIVPGLTPNIDALAKRGTIFRDAISAAPWTRPGTIAMLAGVHSREVGLSPLPWVLVDAQIDAYYRSAPPLVPLSFRRAGAATRAFVNNNFMLGYAPVGVDMGFEQVEDHRYRTADTAEITRSAIESIRAHAGERWFHFVNYNSPHEPFEPPPECAAKVPGAALPRKSDKTTEEGAPPPKPIDPVKRYMAEACKDDAAIGELVAEIDRLGLRERTLIVLTADHGETLSERHDGIADDLDGVRTRFHHAFGMWEETTRIPILLSLPGVVPEARAIDGRVSSLDLAPTVLKLAGLEGDPRQRGIDLVAAAKAGGVPKRPIVTLGRASAAVFWDRWRFVERDREAQKWTVGRGEARETLIVTHELYDLVDDPGETRNLAKDPAHEGTVAEMRARLRAALSGAETADAAGGTSTAAPAKLLVRFAGAGAARRIHATITAKDATRIVATPVGLAPEAVRIAGTVVEIGSATAADALVGIDLVVEPETAPLSFSFALDDKTLEDDAVFGGLLGLSRAGLAKGIDGPEARAAIAAAQLPFVDPSAERGVFLVRVGGASAAAPERAGGAAAAAEIQGALRQWGYAK